MLSIATRPWSFRPVDAWDIAAKRTPQEAKQALAKCRAEADARAKAAIEALRTAEDFLRRHQAAVGTLEGILAWGTGSASARWPDRLAPQPWALDEDDAILGHLLRVEDEAFLAAMEDHRVDG